MAAEAGRRRAGCDDRPGPLPRVHRFCRERQFLIGPGIPASYCRITAPPAAPTPVSEPGEIPG